MANKMGTNPTYLSNGEQDGMAVCWRRQTHIQGFIKTTWPEYGRVDDIWQEKKKKHSDSQLVYRRTTNNKNSWKSLLQVETYSGRISVWILYIIKATNTTM